MLCGCTTHADARHLDVEQPARLDHFQALVEQRRGINRDFAAHDPRRMLERAFDGDFGKLFLRPICLVAKRPAGSREPEFADGTGRLAVETLENRRVLAVHREHAHAVFARLAHHDFAGHDENFLGGDGDVLAGANRGERGLQSGRADNRNQNDVRRRQRRQLDQAFRAGKNLGRNAKPVLHFLRLRRIGDGNGLGPVLARLLEQQFGIVARGEAEQADSIRQILRHLDGAGADGAGAAEKNNVFHVQMCVKMWRRYRYMIGALNSKAVQQVEDAADAGKKCSRNPSRPPRV